MINKELKSIDIKNFNNRLEFLKKYFILNSGVSNCYRNEYFLRPINMELLKNIDIELLKNLLDKHYQGAWGNHITIDNNFNIKIVEYND